MKEGCLCQITFAFNALQTYKMPYLFLETFHRPHKDPLWNFLAQPLALAEPLQFAAVEGEWGRPANTSFFGPPWHLSRDKKQPIVASQPEMCTYFSDELVTRNVNIFSYRCQSTGVSTSRENVWLVQKLIWTVYLNDRVIHPRCFWIVCHEITGQQALDNYVSIHYITPVTPKT